MESGAELMESPAGECWKSECLTSLSPMSTGRLIGCHLPHGLGRFQTERRLRRCGGRRPELLSVNVTKLVLEPRRTALILIDLMPGIIALPTAPLTGPKVLE